ncbi:RHS repeat domain-containing protein [Marinifilum sp. D714]|uniref:RHS repeat domain-containing protein n=1 Tax=Marinifilum sp. D714 TaxID=2937523 RepID=UPI0027D1A654|nr:RHS repeat-associated core domain-containing protein [Marinifilum sp. D714]MDQ2180187.1 RHS repeat-associated core domain-containing protein [Marinifilum sp. D714]
MESKWYTNLGSPDPTGSEPADLNERAAWLAAKHADTPQVRYFDNMGREYMVEDDNGSDGKYRVHTKLDIAGRPVEVTDAKNRLMTTNTFAMQQALQVHNIDSGTRTMLNDAGGQPLYLWDSRNPALPHESFRVVYTYDALRRPLATYLKEENNTEIKVQEQVYGTSDFLNNIGQLEFQYDQSGRTQMVSYDFKGNPEMTGKTFYSDYQGYRDLAKSQALQAKVYTSEIAVDALNRPVSKTLPDGSVETYQYNKAGLLESMSSGGKAYINNINYNEKGQRTDIYYANGSKTKYEYDAKTFRLTRLLTSRNTGKDILQDLNYTYDPVGNIVEQVDKAQQTFYYSNSVIEPKGQYEYDALYRLTKATGRELNSLAMPTHSDFANNIGLPNTAANAMQNYTHNYSYDQLGNMEKVNAEGSWTRNYFYNAHNNYLLGHTDGVNEYTYDAHGNMLSMPHLQAMHWDYNDWLSQVELDANGNKAFYVYNAGGERVRKVVVKGNIREERYYFGDFEIYHKFVSNSLVTERTTVNISDDKKKIATAETLTIDQGSLTVDPVAIIRYQYDNHLGSASLELDESADIISYEEYHPFGTTSYRSGRSETETSQKRYKYVGKERDEETGLYYYGFRYYAAWICRFVSVDPDFLQYPILTPFCNAANNPITLTDYKGRGPIFGKEKAKGANYITGLGYGIVDGAAETVDSAKFVGYLGTYLTKKQNPLSMVGHLGLTYFDSGYRNFSQTMDQIPTIALTVAQQFISDENFRHQVATNLTESISAIPGAIGDYFRELTFQEGNGVAGYQHGKILFEVLVEVATAGAGNAKHIATLLKKGGKELTEFLVRQGVPELLEKKFTKSFLDPTDGINYTRRVAGKHHLFPVSLGNNLRYGHKSLTNLGSTKHTILQGALDDHLKTVKKTLSDGTIVDMFARKGNSRAKIKKNFTLEERIQAVDDFYKTFDNGSYYPAFRMELNAATKADKLK